MPFSNREAVAAAPLDILAYHLQHLHDQRVRVWGILSNFRAEEHSSPAVCVLEVSTTACGKQG